VALLEIRMKKKVVVFGIFDGVHEGHRSLFSQAKQHGDELFVIVGRDSVSLKLKNKTPKFAQEKRVALVQRENNVDQAVLGDEEQSTYTALKESNPDVICLGYDQEALEQDLKRWLSKEGRDILLYRMEPHQPEKYHNSFL
tara:strand:- start:20 stop:442 length:423 start_codon:yes stop_codon:yes gene_type:complete